MVNDDERREVAQRLREFTKDNQWPLTVGGNSSTIRHAISDIVFGDKKYHSGVDLLDRLADLIEPSCDRKALLTLADEMDKWALTCDHYDRRVSPLDVTRYARRIREACGEAVA